MFLKTIIVNPKTFKPQDGGAERNYNSCYVQLDDGSVAAINTSLAVSVGDYLELEVIAKNGGLAVKVKAVTAEKDIPFK